MRISCLTCFKYLYRDNNYFLVIITWYNSSLRTKHSVITNIILILNYHRKSWKSRIEIKILRFLSKFISIFKRDINMNERNVTDKTVHNCNNTNYYLNLLEIKNSTYANCIVFCRTMGVTYLLWFRTIDALCLNNHKVIN